MGLASSITDALFPPACPVTGEETSAHWTLAPQAWAALTRLEPGTGCAKCARPIPGIAVRPGEAPALCQACHTSPRPWERGAAAMFYEATGRELVLAFKEADRLDLAPMIAGWMHAAAPDLVARADVVAPVPLAWQRLVLRRYNQAAELARALCHLADRRTAFAPRLMRRIRNTPRQARLDRDARAANVADAFAPGPEAARMQGRRVLLIDDVLTTGATLTACTNLCLAAGAGSVDVLVSALVPDREHSGASDRETA